MNASSLFSGGAPYLDISKALTFIQVSERGGIPALKGDKSCFKISGDEISAYDDSSTLLWTVTATQAFDSFGSSPEWYKFVSVYNDPDNSKLHCIGEYYDPAAHSHSYVSINTTTGVVTLGLESNNAIYSENTDMRTYLSSISGSTMTTYVIGEHTLYDDVWSTTKFSTDITTGQLSNPTSGNGIGDLSGSGVYCAVDGQARFAVGRGTVLAEDAPSVYQPYLENALSLIPWSDDYMIKANIDNLTPTGAAELYSKTEVYKAINKALIELGYTQPVLEL